MTGQEAVRFINERFVVGWPFRDWGMSLKAERPDGRGEIRVTVVIRSRHRDTGASGTGVRMSFAIAPWMWMDMDTERLALLLRSQLTEAVIHELDESILVDGVRVFDPHAGEDKEP